MQVSAPTRASSAAAAIRANPKDVEDTQNAVRFVGDLGSDTLDAMAQRSILNWVYCKRLEYRSAAAAAFGKVVFHDSDADLLNLGSDGIVVSMVSSGDILITIVVTTSGEVMTYSVSHGDVRTYFLVAMNIVISNSAPPHFAVVDERGAPSVTHFKNFVQRDHWACTSTASDIYYAGPTDMFTKWMSAVGTAMTVTPTSIRDTDRPRIAEYLSCDHDDSSPHELELISILQGAIDPV